MQLPKSTATIWQILQAYGWERFKVGYNFAYRRGPTYAVTIIDAWNEEFP